MTSPAAPPRALVCALAAAATILTVSAPPASAIDPTQATVDRTAADPNPPPAAMERAQDRLRGDLGARGLLQADSTAGTPRIVARLDGYLTPASRRDPATVALAYVRDHASAFGMDASDLATLRLTARRRGTDGSVHLIWEQRAGGVPNVDGGLQAAVDGDGRLINVRGGPLPDPQGPAPVARITAAAAYDAAVPGAVPAPPTGTARGADQRTPFLGGGEASLVLYRDGGVDRLGWRVLVSRGSTAFYDAIVDARTGRLVRRVNRTHAASQIRHFSVNPRASGDTTAQLSPAPAGWLDGERRLKGPYVHAVADLDDTIWLVRDAGGYHLNQAPDATDEVEPSTLPADPDQDWDYPPQIGSTAGFCSQCSWSEANTAANREFSTAQLFWYVNTFRDHLAAAPIGFTGLGAFEGDDAVIAQTLDGADTGPDAAHVSNANMTVLPDGFPGLMQMYLFSSGTGRYDGAMDAGVVYHEYTHGLSERLVTDGQGFGALEGPQPGAIGEGTSDFYAFDFLVEKAPAVVGETANQGDLRLGRWLQQNTSLKGAAAIRTEGLDCFVAPPDSTRCPGMTDTGPGGYAYDDFGKVLGAPEIHADGEIWAQTLWSLRLALTQAHGAPDGLARTRAYVTEGLRLAPTFPTFLDMRNAIVQAAVTLNGNEDWDAIWGVFAARGMGWSAATDGPTDLSPFAATDVPPAPGSGARGAIAGTIEDETGAPVGGATVAIGGHDTGLGATGLAALSDQAGAFVLPDVVAGTYADLYFRLPGFQELTTGVTVEPGQTATRAIKPLRRDYASVSSGGGIAGYTGPNFGGDGCGPGQAIDDAKHAVWSTTADGPKDLVVDLGRALDISQIRIDPRAGCGDGPEASLASYELAASDGPDGPFEAISGGTIGQLDARGYASLSLAGDLAGRRFVRLRAIAPQSLDQGGLGPFMDVAELEITGTPSPILPDPTPTPTPTPTATPTPTPTPGPRELASIRTSKVTASRKGMFKLKVTFAAAAPSGTARFRALAGKKELARATFTTRPAQTVTKTLRLNRAGRKRIKPGRSRKVTVELRLSSGQKLTRSVKLARRR